MTTDKSRADALMDDAILAKAKHRVYSPRGAEVEHYDFSEQELIAFVRDILAASSPADEMAELERLRTIVHQPMNDAFVHGVAIEMEHQRTLHAAGDAEKTPQAWYWTVGYLAGKALFAAMTNDKTKVQHHLITTAALCGRWHHYVSLQIHGEKVGA